MVKSMTAADCAGFTPMMFAVNHGAGEKLDPRISEWLDPVAKGATHCWYLEKDKSTELHYHDFDEYWLWNKGVTELTIRLPDGRSDTFGIGPGWAVYCVRGVEHGHVPREDWGCFEITGVTEPDARKGHLHRTFD